MSSDSLLPVCFSDNQINVVQTLGKTALAAAYQDDKFLQKLIELLKKPTQSQIAKLPIPWREKFRSFSLDSRNFIYMDERLVIPFGLRHVLSSSLHYGHPGRDAMLSIASNIWWPRLHREIVALARSCTACTSSGKNLKPLLRQRQFGTISKSSAPNDEIALDFAGPFSVGTRGKRYLLVSIDNFSGWPDVKLLREPKTSHVLDFLRNYIALHGIPASIRTDPGTVFQSRRFKAFCANRFIRHITCPVSDHRGNGKVERLIRTINERLRLNKQVLLTRESSGLSEILYGLRMYPSAKRASPFERHFNRRPNTITELLTKQNDSFLAPNDPSIQLSPSDFSSSDSTLLVRERTRGSKLESVFQKRRGKILNETPHTVTFQPTHSSKVIDNFETRHCHFILPNNNFHNTLSR